MARKSKLKKKDIRNIDKRPVREKRYKYLFLIVCEDQITEPSYFEKFKAKIPEGTIYLKTIGTGFKPKGIIDKCIEERDNLQNIKKREVDSIWVVFDKDDEDINTTTINNFQDAFKVADLENIQIAYSNEVFELWFLLHFTSISSNVPIPRKQIYQELENNIRKIPDYSSYIYDHNNPDLQILKIIEKHGNQSKAIKRAEGILINQKDKKPIEANPSTRVHKLIIELKKWIEYYSFNPKNKN